MAFDFKKEYKDLYVPPKRPTIVDVPPMTYIAVRGHGDPNAEDSEYKASIPLLYGVTFTIKMCEKAGHEIEGFFPYVAPPLEGFWKQNGDGPIDYAHKEGFEFISAMRVPDFVTEEVFAWAVQEATNKKKTDFSKVELWHVDEGECVQCMHIGSYDTEPTTIEAMTEFAKAQGYVPDFANGRLHHEIYLSDPRKTDPQKLRTVVRHPIRKADA